MVRNLMGCFILIGRGRRPPSWDGGGARRTGRKLAAPTFMPDGLYLAAVGYPENFEVPAPHIGSLPWSAVWEDPQHDPDR